MVERGKAHLTRQFMKIKLVKGATFSQNNRQIFTIQNGPDIKNQSGIIRSTGTTPAASSFTCVGAQWSGLVSTRRSNSSNWIDCSSTWSPSVSIMCTISTESSERNNAAIWTSSYWRPASGWRICRSSSIGRSMVAVEARACLTWSRVWVTEQMKAMTIRKVSTYRMSKFRSI